MIAERVMYHVVCDGCGADAQEGSDYVAWAERATARYEPFINGWGTDGADRDLCPACCPKYGEALKRESDRYCVGEFDPTPIKRPADGWCRAKSDRYSCTWPLGHSHPQHVAGDNSTVLYVWPTTS